MASTFILTTSQHQSAFYFFLSSPEPTGLKPRTDSAQQSGLLVLQWRVSSQCALRTVGGGLLGGEYQGTIKDVPVMQGWRCVCVCRCVCCCVCTPPAMRDETESGVLGGALARRCAHMLVSERRARGGHSERGGRGVGGCGGEPLHACGA